MSGKEKELDCWEEFDKMIAEYEKNLEEQLKIDREDRNWERE